MRSPTIRPATAVDLARCQAIWAATSVHAATDAASAAPNPLYLHELATGRLVVADSDRGSAREIVGFAGAFTRGSRWFLADLFVDPVVTGRGIGTALLDELTREAPARRATLASDDPLASSLYVRAGMAPRWPAYSLVGSLPTRLPPPWLRPEPVSAAATGTPFDELLTWDAQLSGVPRGNDLAWWIDACGATALWLVDELGGRQGYAFVQDTSPSVLDPALRLAATVVTVRVTRRELASDALVAAVGWAAARGRPAARLLLPGPHPALRLLLEAGFRIDDVHLFCASGDDLFDPARDVPSLTLL
jgi:GNAT superfamily N-acetyltransferase